MCVEFMESGWNILVTYHPAVPAMLKLAHYHLGLWETFFKNQYDACHSLLYSYLLSRCSSDKEGWENPSTALNLVLLLQKGQHLHLLMKICLATLPSLLVAKELQHIWCYKQFYHSGPSIYEFWGIVCISFIFPFHSLLYFPLLFSSVFYVFGVIACLLFLTPKFPQALKSHS